MSENVRTGRKKGLLDGELQARFNLEIGNAVPSLEVQQRAFANCKNEHEECALRRYLTIHHGLSTESQWHAGSDETTKECVSA